MNSVCCTACRILFWDSAGGRGSWALLEQGLQAGGTALAVGACCWMLPLPLSEGWEEIDSVTCSACSVQWILEGWPYCVCTLRLRATGTVSPNSHKCWMYCPCLSWLSCFSAAGIAPAPACLQEGFVCQMCLCSLDSWLFSEIFQLGYEQTVKMWPFHLSWAWGAVTRQPLAHVWLASREVWKMGRVSMSFLGRGAEENNVITDVWRCILFSPGIYCEVWMVSVTMNVAFL